MKIIWVLFDLDKNEYVADIGTYVLSGAKLYETTPLVKKAYHFTDEEKILKMTQILVRNMMYLLFGKN